MTRVVLNTTTRKVEVFSSAWDFQARAEIADHKVAADPHPQYLGEADFADIATSGDAADLVSGTVPDGRMPIWPDYTVAAKTALEAAEVPATRALARLLGYASVGDGGGASYIRVDSEPSHAGKIRSTDRFLSDGTTDATNGGWWELANRRVNPFMFGATESGDAQPALQNFFDFVRDNRRTVDVIGEFDIGAKLTIGGGSSFASREIYFDCVMTTTYSSEEEAVRVTNWASVSASGNWFILCGSSTYADRRQWDGVVFDNTQRCILPAIIVRGVKRDGVSIASPSSNMSYAPMLRPWRCGGTLDGTLTSWSNAGSANSVNQRAELTVTDIPDVLAEHDYIIHDDTPYAVTAVDRVGGTVTVFPWLASPTASDPITYVVGSAVKFLGSDSNIWCVGLIDCIDVGVGLKALSLYPPYVTQLHVNVYGIGVVLGRAPNSASVGGNIDNLYLEAASSSINFVEGTSTTDGTSFVVGSAGTVHLSQFFKLNANDGVSLRPKNLSTRFLNNKGVNEAAGNLGGNLAASTFSPDFRTAGSAVMTNRGNTLTVNLAWDADVNRLFGLDTQYIFATGTGSRQEPTGTWTFNAPSGWTINGTAAFSGMAYPTLFACHFDVSSSSVTVTPFNMGGDLKGSATYNPPSIASNNQETTTVTVTGAELGDFAEAAFSLDLQDLILTARVSAANTVTCVFRNDTGGAVDLASGTLRARVRQV